jgi:acyl-coenzyme A synthetase/AMP-(fatty) acid ligase
LTVSEAIRQPSRAEGLACAVDTQHYSFAMLAHWSAGVSATLHGRGVRPGDRVLIQLPNGAELITAILASWHLGAIAVPVLPLLREQELAAVAQQTQPTAVIAGPGSSERVPTAEIDSALAAASVKPLTRLSVAHRTAGWMPFPVRGSVQEQSPPPHPGFANADACALILFTSGTTAEPKGVRHDSRSLLAEVNSYRRSAELTAGDVIFNPAPIAHVGALVISVLVPWCVGAPVVLLSKWDSQRAREAITRERVTFAVGAPYFLNELVALYESADFCGHRLSKFQTGAAPTGSALLARADRVGIAGWRAWGMTEAPSISYAAADDPLDRRANFDGRVEPDPQLIVVVKDGVSLTAVRVVYLFLRAQKKIIRPLRLPRCWVSPNSAWASKWWLT